MSTAIFTAPPLGIIGYKPSVGEINYFFHPPLETCLPLADLGVCTQRGTRATRVIMALAVVDETPNETSNETPNETPEQSSELSELREPNPNPNPTDAYPLP